MVRLVILSTIMFIDMKKLIARYLHKCASYFERGNNLKPLELQDKTITVSTPDTYCGAWYLSQGGLFDRVKEKELSANKIKKNGYKKQWIIVFRDVPVHAVDLYKAGRAQMAVHVMATERRRLKRYIKNYLQPKHSHAEKNHPRKKRTMGYN